MRAEETDVLPVLATAVVACNATARASESVLSVLPCTGKVCATNSSPPPQPEAFHLIHSAGAAEVPSRFLGRVAMFDGGDQICNRHMVQGAAS